MLRSLVACAVLATASVAHAAVLDEDPLEETSTEAGVVARSFMFVLTGDVLEPPISPIDVNPTGVGIVDLRLYFAKRTPTFKLVVHNQLTSSVRSHEASGAFALGRGVAPPRLLPLRYELADDPTMAVVDEVDWVYVAWTRGPVTITAGRQPVSFGRGALVQPTDLVGTFALTEVDTEYKPGADALRVDWNPGVRTAITLVASTGELEADDDVDASLEGTAVLVRGKRSLGWGEVAGTAGYVRGDAVVGIDGIADAGFGDVYAEVTATRLSDDSLASPLVDSGDIAVRGVAGVTYRPTSKLTLQPELVYSDFGASDPDDYLAVAVSPRVGLGEQSLLGRAHAGGVVAWEAHPLVNVTGVALVNVLDPSALLSAGLSYNVSDNVESVLGVYVPVGDAPDAASFDLRSEYGTYPYFAYFELKAVL